MRTINTYSNINLGDNDMAITYNVQAGGKQLRKTFPVYVDVAEQASFAPATAEWEICGKGVEDAGYELNVESETVHDVTGAVETVVKYTEPSMQFDPHTARTGDKLAAILADIERKGEYNRYSSFAVLVVHGYLADAQNKIPAEIHTGCTIELEKIGGDSYVDMPFTIHFSNNKIFGTADISDPANPVFTADGE